MSKNDFFKKRQTTGNLSRIKFYDLGNTVSYQMEVIKMTGKMRAKQMEQDAVKEYGMVMNEGILTLSIIGEIEG